jgi:pyruvate/2-oxoacid:ferredoxin oxidoreductase alpha subunit
MAQLTMEAFNLADKYRNPVMILADAFLGQMTEDMVFPSPRIERYDKSWAVGKGKRNVICSIFLEPDDLEAHNLKLKKKYRQIELTEVRYEEYRTRDADVITVGHGIVSRILRGAVDTAREAGLRVGLFRPITLWPFPLKRLRRLAERVQGFLVVELNTGQMVEDVRLAVGDRAKVNFYGRCGGKVPSEAEIITQLKRMMR